MSRIDYLNTRPTTKAKIDELSSEMLEKLGYSKPVSVEVLPDGFASLDSFNGSAFTSWRTVINRAGNMADKNKYGDEFFKGKYYQSISSSIPQTMSPEYFALALSQEKAARAINELPYEHRGDKGVYFSGQTGSEMASFISWQEVDHMMLEDNRLEPTVKLYEEGIFPLGVFQRRLLLVAHPDKPII